MKVLYIMNHADTGGAALALVELVEYLNSNKEIDITVLTGKNNKLNKKFSQLGIENYHSNFANFLTTKRSPHLFWKNILRTRYYILRTISLKDIKKKINIKDFDIIHSNLDRIDIGARLANTYNIPHIWHIREHGDIDFPLENLLFEKNYIKYMNSTKSYNIAVSNSVKFAWENKGLQNVETIYDGVKFHENDIKNKNKTKKINIIFLGGYKETKGQMIILKALALLQKKYLEKIKIDFFGEDFQNYKQSLVEYSKKNCLIENVSFNSYENDITTKLSNYDIGINCSEQEGFGRITVEYLYNNLFVIATNSGANKEIIMENIDGILFEKNNPNELAKCLVNYVDGKYNLISDSSRISKHFSIKTHGDNVYELYKKVMK